MFEPVYKTADDKPVYAVRNAHIKKVENGYEEYELQLNGEYYQISEDMLNALSNITIMRENVGISIG